jgi:hypothetical protein
MRRRTKEGNDMTAFLALWGLGLCLLAMAKIFALLGATLGILTLAAAVFALFFAFGDNSDRLLAPFPLAVFLAALGCAEVLLHKPAWSFGITFGFALGCLLASAEVLAGYRGEAPFGSPLHWNPLHRHRVKAP